MSMVQVRSHVEGVAKSLGYKIDAGIFTDKLNAQSPKSAFVSVGRATPAKTDMRTVDFEAPVNVRLFVGKGMGSASLEERTTAAAEEFIAAVMNATRPAGVKHYAIAGYDALPFEDSNERVPVAQIELEAVFVLGF
jgi:tartrate dehydratase beta subunit/fumarate hydratase class I family protein